MREAYLALAEAEQHGARPRSLSAWKQHSHRHASGMGQQRRCIRPLNGQMRSSANPPAVRARRGHSPRQVW
jgi:hypothetical protein